MGQGPNSETEVNELKNEVNFTSVSWNIDGIINKLDDQHFIDYISKFMIVCLFETFVDNINLTEYFPGYDCYIAPAIVCAWTKVRWYRVYDKTKYFELV